MVSHHFLSPLGHGIFFATGLAQVIFELNAIPTSTSSCRLRAGETEVLVALKCHVLCWMAYPFGYRYPKGDFNQRYVGISSFASWELMTMPSITARLLRWLLRW